MIRSQATLAQLVERLIRNQQVAGSIPAGGSNLKSMIYGPALCGLSSFCQLQVPLASRMWRPAHAEYFYASVGLDAVGKLEP